MAALPENTQRIRHVGPFVRYYTSQCHLLLYTPVSSATTTPSRHCSRKGRRSSDVTVGYIRTRKTLHRCFFSSWKPRRGYHATEARIILEKKLTSGFSLILLTGQTHEKLSELKACGDRKSSKSYFTNRRRGFNTQPKKNPRMFSKETEFSFFFFYSNRLLTVRHIFPFAKGFSFIEFVSCLTMGNASCVTSTEA
ncbi:hypothetical protein AMECASPLE_026166 [Ameca splendens]|uniref:Uncharacterized protein n=1 Tax=Ameca splendens TaxID=208324 RepID=A0ABV0ZSG6_9TELE